MSYISRTIGTRCNCNNKHSIPSKINYRKPHVIERIDSSVRLYLDTQGKWI
ncbi:hypothetical protein Tsubulata_041811 [Turnera subulata]|uniref:Uncharacterized protein n=1 Tax=Turnera subulata TaxID=218843 RepID=A0A9Q0GNT7_9ROSI|nr:hypothetical protein Tsubulata_041811 [Turnera subulata]